ncbi:MAG: alpha/beta fold hydrolase [Microcystaceae cyanobacterium]
MNFPNCHWQKRIGRQREWIWRGWSIRYSFWANPEPDTSQRPPLILIHGFGASIDHWRNNIKVLGEYSAVYALDLLGFGGSRKANTPYSMELWTAQVYDFWRTVINKPVVLIGNSIGSLVALTAVVTHPEMAKGLIMLSLPDVAARQEMLPKAIEPIVRFTENIVAKSGLLTLLFYFVRQPHIIHRWAGIAYQDKQAVDYELVEIIARPPQDEDAVTAFNALFRSTTQANFAQSVKQLLPHVSIPILLIWGKQDRMIPFFFAAQFAQLNPNITLIELEGVGHCPQDECPDRLNQEVLNFMTLI